MLKRSTLREIRNSKERYLAILAIVALGVGFFSGLKVTKQAMLSTCQNYLEDCGMYDYQIVTSYGIDDKSVETAKKYPGVKSAEAAFEQDYVIDSNKGAKLVYRAMNLPESVNVPQLKEGRLPEADNECVVDDYASSFKVGDTVVLSDDNDKDALKNIRYREFKVVGTVTTPIFLDYQRGSTSLGDGSLSSFFFVRDGAWTADYYTSMYLKLKGGKEYFGDDADDFLDEHQSDMEALASKINRQRRNDAIEKANEALQEKVNEYESGLAEYNRQRQNTQSQLSSASDKLDTNANELASKKKSLNSQLTTLRNQRPELVGGIEQLKGAIAQLEALGDNITDEQRQMLGAYKKQEKTLNGQLVQLDKGIAQIEAGLEQIVSGEKQIEDGRKELANNRSMAESEFARAKSTLDAAKAKLDEAQEKIDDMEAGNSYVFTRNDNTGFSVFDENAGIVEGIAKIFPLFFFLVAALVCMTTMTRMVDEHRTQIGILKALGYSNSAILGKYLFYSGSAAVIGAVAGFFAGCKIFPAVIWNAYGMMYDFNPKIEYVINWRLGLVTLAVAVICSMGATWASCASDFGVQAAELIRPKTPKAGKRILLERIPAIWKRIGFLYKVSIRNTFRYKKRFFMMVLGVSGCTALLIAGFGINTTIKNVAKFQFEEVLNYDYLLAFNGNMSADSQKDFIEYAGEKTDDKVGDILFLHEASADVSLKGESVQVILVATDDSRISDFISLHDGGRDLEYPKDGEAIVCREMQQRHNVDVGDTITIKDGYRKATVKVTGVCDNYVRNYVYITKSCYDKAFGKKASIKTALVKAPSSASDDEIREASTALKKNSKVAAAAVNLDTIDMVENMMKSLDAVVFVVILCAGLLAFIVLYNLTNINITERIREVATIKVLGFYDKETQQYVFRENYFLTAIAALVGIFLGKWLLDFVISKICVNTIFFVSRITVMDYVYSVILTFVFAVVVSFAMRKRLRNISMTESLKSIE